MSKWKLLGKEILKKNLFQSFLAAFGRKGVILLSFCFWWVVKSSIYVTIWTFWRRIAFLENPILHHFKKGSNELSALRGLFSTEFLNLHFTVPKKSLRKFVPEKESTFSVSFEHQAKNVNHFAGKNFAVLSKLFLDSFWKILKKKRFFPKKKIYLSFLDFEHKSGKLSNFGKKIRLD